MTCEYQYGTADRQYISYEYVYSYDDRDVMFAKSLDDGATWSLRKLHGGWPDGNVHCQTSIATTRGSDGNDYIYIAYEWGADYNTAYDIVIDKSKNRGSTWTQQWVCDESARDKNWPSISATHGTGTVVIAWHVYIGSYYLNDVQCASSTNNGGSWYVSWLAFEANASEENPIVTVDGKDSTSTIVYGYVHIAYWKDSKVCYKKASFDSPWLWTEIVTVTDPAAYVPAAYNRPTITTYKHPDGLYLPVVAWADQRSASCDIYCSRAAIQRNLTAVSAHGNPNPAVGDHVYFDGDFVTCNVSSPVTENGVVWTCSGWNGNGSVPSKGTGTSVTFTITEDSSLYWNWQPSRIDTHIVFTLLPNPASPTQTVTLSGDLTDVNINPVYPAQVKVDCSKNGGVTWISLWTLNTNSAGAFSRTFVAPAVGTYLFRVSYAGSATYNPSSYTQKLTVQTGAKVNTQITFTLSPNPANPGQSVKLSGTLKTVGGSAVYPAVVTVKYSKNGGVTWISLWTLNTNSAGAFSKTFTAPAVGTYLFRVSYAGSTSYNPSSRTETLKVQ
jgi:hypothetical protein